MSTPAPWVTLAAGGPVPGRARRATSTRRVYAQLVAAAVVAFIGVAVGGAYASRQVAVREAVNDATRTTDLLAEAVITPALEDGLVTGSAAARARLDKVVRDRVLGSAVVRVKLWTAAGVVIYSDEPRIIGERFALGEDERGALTADTTHGEVSDLTRPENRFERGQGKLLEVYRGVRTPGGQPLLFETYLPYDRVSARTGQLLRSFGAITLTSLLVLTVLLLPILWRLLDNARAAQDEQVALLQRAVDASSDERRRIAGTLHDGVVQELAAASFSVSGAAERADGRGEPELAGILRSAAQAVRGAIGGLRSLLVDIYPPGLRAAGLGAALGDAVSNVRSRDVEVRLQLPAPGEPLLDPAGEQLVYRVAQEALRNVARHASAAHVDLSVTGGPDAVTLLVADDGVGFDVAQVLRKPSEGHFGLRVMTDLAAQGGARLDVSSAPGQGTRWRLVVPRP